MKIHGNTHHTIMYLQKTKWGHHDLDVTCLLWGIVTIQGQQVLHKCYAQKHEEGLWMLKLTVVERNLVSFYVPTT
jgi:hypothetical protein